MSTSVTFRGREVVHPFWRPVVAITAVVGATLSVLVLIPIFVAGILLALLAHPLLRLCGCRGTVRRTYDSLDIGFDREAFRRW